MVRARCSIRRIARPDLPQVVELVRGLAGVEQASEFHLSTERLADVLFGDQPVLHGHVAELGGDGGVVGCSLWYLTYSTYQAATAIYLEDLYVSSTHRGQGIGRALLAALAQESLDRGCPHLDWSVVISNTQAIHFYDSLGATVVDGQIRYRLTGSALHRIAGGEAGDPH